MKIAFFTEGNIGGKVSRGYPNMRTDMAWLSTLNADRIPYFHVDQVTEKYDLGICIIPKQLEHSPDININLIKTKCDRICSMQEGPQWVFQDYSLSQQIWFYNILQEMDFLFVHNQIDKKYFEGLTNKECKIMPSLMIEDRIKDLPQIERTGVMIGGNFCSWYGGFDSYMIAQEFNDNIFIPSMGRKIEGEEQMENLTHLPYMEWVQWIRELNKRKYGVHLMRTQAAGTFALNCAYLGIPCIGYKGLDTQMICHPDTTIEIGDLPKAKQIAKKLRLDEEFYLYCSNNVKENYKNYYHEDKFNNTFQKQFKIS